MWREAHHSDAVLATPSDLRVAEVAASQHGVVSLAQLKAAGLGRGGIGRRVKNGRLHPWHRGVYAVGHARLTWEGRLWAAVLATDAVLSHRSAAALWDLLPTPAGPIELTTTGQSRSTKALRVHRSTTLTAADVTRHEGLPLTTPSRTIKDLQDVIPPRRLAQVLDRAELQRKLDLADLATTPPGRRAKVLRHALGTLADTGPTLTRSELERRFLAIVDAHDLPRPLVNQRAAGLEVDFLWPAERLIVEVDGAATHLTPRAFERDRARDARLLLAGYRVVRFTHRQIALHRPDIAHTVRSLLSLDSAPPRWGSRAVKGDGL